MIDPIPAPGKGQTFLGPEQRAQAWERLGSEQFDVVVIGGGVVGAGAALDAATRGLKVALVEARDFASGHVEPVVEDVPRRPALPGAAGVRAGARGAARTRAVVDDAGAAPGQAACRSCSR